MRGRSSTQPFLVEIKKGGCRLSPQRVSSPAPLGNPVAPSSVTFGDSFPPRGSLWAVQPYTKKRPKSGHVHGYRTSPSTGTMRPTTPKRASGNERALSPGVQGACPRPSFSPFLGRNGDPAGQAGPPGRCVPRHRKSPDHPKGTQYPTAPPPGTGRETTSQAPPCAGPEGTPSLPKRTPSRWAAWGPFHVCRTVVAGGAGTLTPGPRQSGGPCWPAPGRPRRSRPRRRGPPGSPSGSEGGCPRRRRG